MQTIGKAVVDVSQKYQATFDAPHGAEFLCVSSLGGDIFVWFRCNSEPSTAPVVKQFMGFCGTGDQAPYGRYVGTVHLEGRELHFFESNR